MGVTLIYLTIKTHSQALSLSQTLLSEKRIACANIGSEITSVYTWNDKPETTAEVPVLLKTTPILAQTVIERIQQLHDYEIPCILSQEIHSGSSAFIEWIQNQVSTTPRNFLEPTE